MKLTIGLSLVLAVGMIGCGKNEEATPAGSTNEDYGSGNPVTAPVDYLGAVNKAQKSAVRTLDVASLKTAINLFQAQEDRYPKDLNELVEKRYIREVPSAPAGSSIEYNAQNGEVRIVKTQ